MQRPMANNISPALSSEAAPPRVLTVGALELHDTWEHFLGVLGRPLRNNKSWATLQRGEKGQKSTYFGGLGNDDQLAGNAFLGLDECLLFLFGVKPAGTSSATPLND